MHSQALSSLALCLFFVRVREEPGNEAIHKIELGCEDIYLVTVPDSHTEKVWYQDYNTLCSLQHCCLHKYIMYCAYIYTICSMIQN